MKILACLASDLCGWGGHNPNCWLGYSEFFGWSALTKTLLLLTSLLLPAELSHFSSIAHTHQDFVPLLLGSYTGLTVQKGVEILFCDVWSVETYGGRGG